MFARRVFVTPGLTNELFVTEKSVHTAQGLKLPEQDRVAISLSFKDSLFSSSAVQWPVSESMIASEGRVKACWREMVSTKRGFVEIQAD
jgi:hypothetical protein